MFLYRKDIMEKGYQLSQCHIALARDCLVLRSSLPDNISKRTI